MQGKASSLLQLQPVITANNASTSSNIKPCISTDNQVQKLSCGFGGQEAGLHLTIREEIIITCFQRAKFTSYY